MTTEDLSDKLSEALLPAVTKMGGVNYEFGGTERKHESVIASFTLAGKIFEIVIRKKP